LPPQRVLDTSAGTSFTAPRAFYLASPAKDWDEHFRFARATARAKISISAAKPACRPLPRSRAIRRKFGGRRGGGLKLIRAAISGFPAAPAGRFAADPPVSTWAIALLVEIDLVILSARKICVGSPVWRREAIAIEAGSMPPHLAATLGSGFCEDECYDQIRKKI
jgi:hypothetical protein